MACFNLDHLPPTRLSTYRMGHPAFPAEERHGTLSAVLISSHLQVVGWVGLVSWLHTEVV